MTEELARLALQQERQFLDDDWSETVIAVLPLALHTRNEQKRMRFALLLARAASYDGQEARDESRTMAQILDQLEFAHVKLLDQLLARPRSQQAHGLWGGTSDILLDDSGLYGNDVGRALLRLEGIGLLTVIDAKTQSPGKLNKIVRINDLGLELHKWIRPPAA